MGLTIRGVSADGTERRTAIIARSVHGLEWVCAAEVCAVAAGSGGLRLTRRQVDFEVDSAGPRLLELRTADDAFLKVAEIEGVGSAKADLPALGRATAALDWLWALDTVRAVREVPAHGSFDVVASIEGRRSYNRFAVERTVGLAISPALRATFLPRDGAGPAGADSDLTVRVFVRDDVATLAVRLGARPLHRRAYKVSTGPGTLHPPVGAALAAIAAPAAGTLLDPFCGDGTIAIEAALAHPHLRIVASDIDPLRVRNASENAARAGVHVQVRRADAAALADRPEQADAIVSNPPWEKAVSASGRLRAAGHGFWDALARALRPDGVVCCITDADLGVPDAIASHGWQLGLEQRVRLAGRVADVSLAAPPGTLTPGLSPGLAKWREEAIAAGVVTEAGFC
jgi:tRNA (guanine6-N2)-methyltransferase